MKAKATDIIFETKEEAERILDYLNQIVDKYAVVSKADLLELVGFPSTYEDNKRGWTQLKNVKVRKETRYVIDLPPMENIDI